MSTRRRFFLVFNRHAGTARHRAVDDLVAALAARGASVDRAPDGSMEDVRAASAVAARSGRYDALIACGGDGTVRQVAIAAADTACPVAACMLGTGNVLAHELGLPRTPDILADAFIGAPDVAVRMARANGEPFLLMAGTGFDGRVIAKLNQTLKQRLAKLAYVPATLGAVAAPLDALTVTIDGGTCDGGAQHQATWVVVTSAGRYGGAFRLTARTSLRETGLVAILFKANRRADLVRHNVDLALGRLDQIAARDDGTVTMLAAQTVQIASCGAPVPVQVDGDAFGATPLLVSVDGPLVRLIAPDPPRG